MTIKELKEAIAEFPDDTEILVYLHGVEDAAWLHKVEDPVEVQDADTKYCKGDSPMNPRYDEWVRNNPQAKVVWFVG